MDDSIDSFVDSIRQQYSDEERAKIAEHLQKELGATHQCNQCGTTIDDAKWGSTKVEVHWGYNSTGKDTDTDKWRLCSECSKAFNREYPPICSICNTSIIAIMASLMEKTVGSSFYGDFVAALDYFKNDDHCGLEYATVAGSVVCEICYEEMLGRFKVPVLQRSYMVGSGDVFDRDNVIKKNRIEEALNFTLSEDSMRYFYQDCLDLETTRDIRQTKDPNRVYSIGYSKAKPGYKALYREKWVTLDQGSGSSLFVSADWIKQQAVSLGVTANLEDIQILDGGDTIRFGELRLKTVDLVTKWGGFVPDEYKEMTDAD